jgi:hypothetical protein
MRTGNLFLRWPTSNLSTSPDKKFVYGPLSFLRAEWWDKRSRFVLVRYSLEGKEQGPGLTAVAPPPSPGPAHYLVARDHRLPALRHVHLLMNVLHRDLLVSARSLALKREQALLIGGCHARYCSGKSASPH